MNEKIKMYIPTFTDTLLDSDKKGSFITDDANNKSKKEKKKKNKGNKEIEQIAIDDANAVANSNPWNLFNDKKYPGFKEKFRKLLYDFQYSKIKKQYTPKEKKDKWKWGSIKWFIDDCEKTYNFTFHKKLIIYDPIMHIADYYDINHRKNNIFVFDDYKIKEYDSVREKTVIRKWSKEGFEIRNEWGDGNTYDDQERKRSEHDEGVSPTDYILFLIKRFKRILEHYNENDLEILMYHIFKAMWETYEVNDFDISPKNIYDWCSGNLEGTKKVSLDKVGDLIRTFKYNEQFDRKIHHQKVYEDPDFPGARVLYNKRKTFKALCVALITVIKDESKPELNWQNIGKEFIITAHKMRLSKRIEELYTIVFITENDWNDIDEETKKEKGMEIIDTQYREGFWHTNQDERMKRLKTGEGTYLQVRKSLDTKITRTEYRECLVNVTRIKKLYNDMLKDEEFINSQYKAFGIPDDEMSMVINCNIKEHKEEERKNHKEWMNKLKELISKEDNIDYQYFCDLYRGIIELPERKAFNNYKSKLKKKYGR